MPATRRYLWSQDGASPKNDPKGEYLRAGRAQGGDYPHGRALDGRADGRPHCHEEAGTHGAGEQDVQGSLPGQCPRDVRTGWGAPHNHWSSCSQHALILVAPPNQGQKHFSAADVCGLDPRLLLPPIGQRKLYVWKQLAV